MTNKWILAIWKFSRLSGNFPDHPENIKTIRNLSRLSGNFPDHPETFLENIQTTQKLSSYPEKLLAIWKISRLSGFFPGFRETFWTIRRLSWLSRNFQGYSETFRTIWKISRLSGNFPDGPETFQCNLKGYVQKLSGWQCHHATKVFGPLGSLRARAYNMSSPISEISLDWSGLMIHPKMNSYTLRLFNPLYVTPFKMFFFLRKKCNCAQHFAMINTEVHDCTQISSDCIANL